MYWRPGLSAEAALQQWDTDIFQRKLTLLTPCISNTELNLKHFLADNIASVETDQKATSSPLLVT